MYSLDDSDHLLHSSCTHHPSRVGHDQTVLTEAASKGWN